MPMGRLAQVLRDTKVTADPRLLVGPDTFDDAGIVSIGVPGAPLLVQTADFFPPVVDHPYWYGAIAAANSLSDVYAMGGRPLSAITLAGFPKDFDEEWIAEIMRGGFEKIREAGAVVAGGHTVESELQFGFAVTGLVDEDQVTANTGAKVGDLLYLTKRLGMGTMTTASKRGLVDWATMEGAARQMAHLNAKGAEAMVAAGCRAATDVTGFGLMGHARNVADGSKGTLRFVASDLPLWEGARDLAAQGVCSGGSKRNRSALESVVRIGGGVDPAVATCVFDAETSGGLLIVIARDRADRLEQELAARGEPVHRVGEVVAPDGVFVELV
ncbi:MAG: selenide, water dikinase SelD [Planctomycetota bacterium]